MIICKIQICDVDFNNKIIKLQFYGVIFYPLDILDILVNSRKCHIDIMKAN